MADFRLNELTEASAIANSDIMHLRTTGGIDKKITGTNLRDTLVAQVLNINTSQGISLSAYTTDLTIIGTQTSPITLTITNVLNNGRLLKVLNPTAFIMTILIGGQTIEVSNNGELNFTSNSSAMIIGRKNLTTITGNTTYTLNKGTKGKVFICEPTADMTLTLAAGGGVDEREHITVINNSTYTVTVKDATYDYWLEDTEKADFRFDYDGDLKRSAGWGLVWAGSSQTIVDAALLDGKPQNGEMFLCRMYQTSTSSHISSGIAIIGDNTINNDAPAYISTNAFGYEGVNNYFDSDSTNYICQKLWKWYE